ncbi:MAG TPA: copper-translocating P-type ATPase [Prolixibacteraceae bacterium]|nr:copper-translocating P-type ATPase [Prolixibacteraceae bacterium]
MEHPKQPDEPAKMDHSKMDHGSMKHGDNPSMGMEGHNHHAMMIADFKKRFYVVLILSVPIVLLSTMIQKFMGVDWQFTGSKYILLALSTAVFFYGGWPFFKGLITEIKTKTPGMMFLIGFAITSAYTYSAAVVFGLEGMDFFWELATLILIMLLGHWIEMKSVAGASKELELLVQMMPADAHMVMPDMVHDVKTETLKENDIILVKPGEKVAADGIILEGESYLNESMITGESTPVKKIKGQKVIAGSINGNGSIKVTVSHASKDSYISQLVKLVDDAQKSKSKTQLLADTAAKWLTIIAIVAGISTFLYWYLTGQTLAFALERMITVVVICCPHALGLAVPLVVAKSTAISAKNGLLIKNRIAFENSRKITTIVFDKTGTLTVGKFEVSKIVSLKKELTEDEIIRIASALEQQSEHPIATGILLKAKDLSVDIPSIENFKAITGKGIEATVEGKKVLVVSPGYLKENKIAVPEDFKADDTETVVFVIINNELAGYIALSDELRAESAEAIKTLKENHIKSILLTGDNSKVAKSVSDKLGLDSFIAEVLPDQKLDKIKELQGKGEFVAMTGDGVNDAPALAQADVGIAVGSGSDIAAETAGIVLVNSNPKDIVNLILFGKATHRKMIQNLIWATGYNIVALPLAAGVLYAWHILLTPAIGAALMSVSTVIVAVNASMLRLKEEPKPDSKAEPQKEVKDENKTEAKDDSQPETKDESKSEGNDEPMTEAKDESQPEVKDEANTKVESQPEAKDESKPEAKSESQAESKDEPMPSVTDETKPEAKDETETKGGNKPEENVKIPSSVSPEIVKRVQEFYEELGREDVRAVMDMEKTEQEIPKPETKAEAHPITKSEPKVKAESKPETSADKTSDSTLELVTRVHELYEKLGRGDVSAVQNMDETEPELQESESKVGQKPEVKTEVKVDPEHKDHVATKIAVKVKSKPDIKAKSKPKAKSGHQQVVKAKPKPGSKK